MVGDDALERVHECNTYAKQELGADGEAMTLVAELKTILDSLASIPNVVRRGDQLYNSWTDAEHPRGLRWRTSVNSYHTEEPDREVLIDADIPNTAGQED